MMNKGKRRTGIGRLNPNFDANIAVHISTVANPSTIATDYILQDRPKEKKTRNRAR